MSSDPTSIQQMFSAVAPRYDLLNRILSLGQDQGWRRAVVRAMKLSPGDRALDLCCGTGDLAMEIAQIAKPFACDFSNEMLSIAQAKLGSRAELTAGDALCLPYAANSFEATAIVFGIRNLADLSRGFTQAFHSLKAGGRLVVVEFSRPDNRVLRWLHAWYVRVIVPWIGRALSPNSSAYQYLADTIAEFHGPPEIASFIEQAGFSEVSYQPLSMGIVTLYRAKS